MTRVETRVDKERPIRRQLSKAAKWLIAGGNDDDRLAIRNGSSTRDILLNPQISNPDIIPNGSQTDNHTVKIETVNPSAPSCSIPTDSMITAEMYHESFPLSRIPQVKRYFGRPAAALTAYADPGSIQARIQAKIDRFQSNHPGVSPEDLEQYSNYLQDQIDSRKKKAERRVLKRFYSAVQEEHGLDSQEDAARLYRDAYGKVLNSFNYVRRTIFPGEVAVDPREEIKAGMNPARVVLSYNAPSEDQSKLRTIRHEIRRQLLTMHPTAELIQRNEIIDKLQKPEQVIKLFDDKLFEGPKGATETLTVYGHLANGTNELLEILIDEPTVPANRDSHYVELSGPCRKIKDTDMYVLLAGTTRKTDESSITKMVIVASDNSDKGKGDQIDPTKIQDTHRMKMVIIGKKVAETVDGEEGERLVLATQEDADNLTLQIFNTLADQKNEEALYHRDIYGDVLHDDNGLPLGRVTDLTIDDKTNKRKGQSKKVDFKRIKYRFSGMDADFEVMVATLPQQVVQVYDVGKYDPETGKFSGAGHELYVLQRLFDLVKHWFPKEIYSVKNHPDKKRRYPLPIVKEVVNRLRRKNVFEVKSSH